MAVVAVQHIRPMRGGAQSHLMLGSDRELYVVKFRNNPQHVRVLANEYLATRIAEDVGLQVPKCDVVDVSEWLVTHTDELKVSFGRSVERCCSGLQFGSKFVGGLMPGQLLDYLPEQQGRELKNLGQFAGILALDKWTGNANGRQAVYLRRGRERRYTAVFIDQGYCFGGGEWRFWDSPLRGVYGRNWVYAGVTGWQDFSPWIERLEEFPPEKLWAIVEEIPPEWYGDDEEALVRLVEQLIARRSRVREMVEAFRDSDRRPFPNWGGKLEMARRQFLEWSGENAQYQ